LEFVDSTTTLAGANTIARLRVGSGAKVTAATAAALGGPDTALTVLTGGELGITALGTPAGSLDLRTGARLVFHPRWAANTAEAMLTVTDASLADGAIIGFGTFISGDYLLLKTTGTLTAGAGIRFDPGPNAATGLDLAYFKIDPDTGTVSFGALSQDANPGKDIAAAYDALAASTHAIYARVSETFLMGFDRPPEHSKNSAWIKAVGSISSHDGNPGPADAGYNTVNSHASRPGYRSDTHGAIAGFDRRLSEKLLLGAYAGQLIARIRTDGHASDTDASLPHAGLYGALRLGPAYLAADVMGGLVKADTTRFEQIGRATGSYEAAALAASLQAGALLGAATGKGAVKPSLSLHYMRLDWRKHREHGVGPDDLGAFAIDDLAASTLETLASLQATRNFTTPWKTPACIDALLGWRVTLADSPMRLRGRFASGTPFALDADLYSRNAALFGLALRFAFADNSCIALGYDYELGSEFDRHSLNATLRLNW
jgi:outer membrane autotransporter protein